MAAMIMVAAVCMGLAAAEDGGAPAIFVFGDSLVDAGNNNYIYTFSKANYAPNGVDFVDGPTGRYTNGRTIVDILGQEIGVTDFIPPYLAPATAGSVLLRGVNYASGAGGILNHTGVSFGGRINMDAQIDNFANTKREIASSQGAAAAAELLNRRSLFFVAMGSNDFINNYIPVAPIKQGVTPPDAFVAAMVFRFRLQLTRLYDLGGRRFLVANVGPIGCIPFERDSDPDPAAGDDCVEFPNHLARLFNARLRTLVAGLNTDLSGATFVYADVYHIVSDIIQNGAAHGFLNTNSSCCAVAGRFGGLVPCGAASRVCADRSEFFFWDPYHPADASNVLITRRLLDSRDSNDVWPVNVRRLVQGS